MVAVRELRRPSSLVSFVACLWGQDKAIEDIASLLSLRIIMEANSTTFVPPRAKLSKRL